MDAVQLKLLAHDLSKKSDEELAAFRANKVDTSEYAILADKEFEKRARQKQHELERELLAEQHKLDLELVIKQVHWMQFSAILGVAGTIVGAIVGAVLTVWLR
jgi:hypothetical protein